MNNHLVNKLNHLVTLEILEVSHKDRILAILTDDYIEELLNLTTSTDCQPQFLIDIAVALQERNLPSEYIKYLATDNGYIDYTLLEHLFATDRDILERLLRKEIPASTFTGISLYSDYYTYKRYDTVKAFSNLKVLMLSLDLTNDYDDIYTYLSFSEDYYPWVMILTAHKDETFLNTVHLNLDFPEFIAFLSSYVESCSLEQPTHDLLFYHTDTYLTLLNECLQYRKESQDEIKFTNYTT